MKKQILKLSPHQNGKVAGILVAVTMLPMFFCMIIPMMLFAPKVDSAGNPIDFPFILFLLMPIFYLVFTYLFVALGCWIYNKLYRFVGGFEFEIQQDG